MILTRLGNKRRIAKKILPFFPEHDIYIEPFFGAGGMFFSKPKAKYNFLNDADEEVYNLFNVVRERREELEIALSITPQHQSLFQHWRKAKEDDSVWRAVRFLMLSNLGYMGKPDTLHLYATNAWKNVLANIQVIADKLSTTKFSSMDFEKALLHIHYRNPEREKAKAFIYADPPYLKTGNNYASGFTGQDTARLFRVLVDYDVRFAISEFDNPYILELADLHRLNVHVIGERQNLKSRRIEILVTNY